MTDLSYTQEFFLCALNRKGNISALMVEDASVCFIVGGTIELLNWGYLARIEKDKLIAGKTWDNALPHLKPLYERITTTKKPRTIHDIAINYGGKSFNELLSAIGDSLVESNCAEKLIKKGLFREKTKYIPQSKAVKQIIEKVRAEFLEDGKMTDETVCLAAMLDHSGLIRSYFSKIEADDMKKRLKEVRKSEAYQSIKTILDELAAIVMITTMSAVHS